MRKPEKRIGNEKAEHETKDKAGFVIGQYVNTWETLCKRRGLRKLFAFAGIQDFLLKCYPRLFSGPPTAHTYTYFPFTCRPSYSYYSLLVLFYLKYPVACTEYVTDFFLRYGIYVMKVIDICICKTYKIKPENHIFEVFFRNDNTAFSLPFHNIGRAWIFPVLCVCFLLINNLFRALLGL